MKQSTSSSIDQEIEQLCKNNKDQNKVLNRIIKAFSEKPTDHTRIPDTLAPKTNNLFKKIKQMIVKYIKTLSL